jgi:hypothetical protein
MDCGIGILRGRLKAGPCGLFGHLLVSLLFDFLAVFVCYHRRLKAASC